MHLSCATPPPTDRRHSAGRCWAGGVICLILGGFLPRSPTIAPPPSPRLSTISGSAAVCEDRLRGAEQTSSSIRDRGYRRTHECQRPAHSSPSSASAPPSTHPALGAGCAAAGTHRRLHESLPHKSA